MAVSVTMPRLGESVSEGTVTRWLKKEGERVEADEPLLEVSTDKVDTEIPSPAAGVLKSIKVGEDETVEVGVRARRHRRRRRRRRRQLPPRPPRTPSRPRRAGTGRSRAGAGAAETTDDEPDSSRPRARAAAGRAAAATRSRRAPTQATRQPPPSGASRPQPPTPPRRAERAATTTSGGGGPSYVTPLVRRLAAEHGVDLADVHGTGVGGRIRKQDVLDAAEERRAASRQPSSGRAPAAAEPPAARPAQPPAPASGVRVAAADPRLAATPSMRGRTEKLSRLRTVIAQRMVESLQISAQLTTVVEVDLTRIARLRERAKAEFEAREGVKLSYLPFFALAACEALREHPAVNSSIDLEAGTATYHDSVHLGIAVDTPRGLLVPVIKDASDLNLAGLARKIADLAERTRGNHITPDELGGGTFTLTNTGSRGALFDTPIINQPQVGILGTGAVVKRPVVVDDPDVGEVIAVRHMVLPRADLRPPHGRRRRRRALPRHDQGAAGRRRVRGRPRPLTAMKVVVAGASGLIGDGSALVRSLTGDGHDILKLVRRDTRRPDEASWDPSSHRLDSAVLAGADAVVNLAGAGIGDKRWTDDYKKLGARQPARLQRRRSSTP